jgi:DNA-binding MarR family transcriptional regulator
VSEPSDHYRAAAEFRTALLGFQRSTEEIAARHRLTPQRYLLLLLIRVRTDAGERATVTSLREPLQMSQSAVTQLVLGAEAAGLVKRVPDPRDARSHALRLTADGSQRLRRTFDDLSGERATLLSIIQSLAPRDDGRR